MHEGQIIKFIRKEKKISQASLVKGICSVRHLSNIESGKSTITYDLIMKFMQRLGTDLNYILNEDIKKYGFDLFRQFIRLEELFHAWNYVELYKLILEVQADFMLESYLLKKIMYYKAICVQEVENDSKKAQMILMNLLEIDSTSEVMKQLKRYNDTLNLDIINALAVSLSNEGSKRNSLDIFLAIKRYLLEHEVLDSELGVKVLFNILKLQYDIGLFEECIDIAEENISLCKGSNRYKYYPDTYIYLARAMKKLEIEGYKKYYKKGIYLFHLFGDAVKIHSTLEFIIKSNDIDIDHEMLEAEV